MKKISGSFLGDFFLAHFLKSGKIVGKSGIIEQHTTIITNFATILKS
jgi:hypothetical protein